MWTKTCEFWMGKKVKGHKTSHTHARTYRGFTYTSTNFRPKVFPILPCISSCSLCDSFSLSTQSTPPPIFFYKESTKCYKRNYLWKFFVVFGRVMWSMWLCSYEREFFPTTTDVHFHFHPSHNIFLSFLLFWIHEIYTNECQVEWKFFFVCFTSHASRWFPWFQVETRLAHINVLENLTYKNESLKYHAKFTTLKF